MHELISSDYGKVGPLCVSLPTTSPSPHCWAARYPAACGSTIRHTPRQRCSRPATASTWPAPRPQIAAAVFRRLFAETIYPAARSAGMYTLYFGDEGWDRLVASVLEGKAPIRSVREYYVMRDTGQECRPAPLPDGFELRIVDEALLADRSLAGLAELEEELCSERPSVEESCVIALASAWSSCPSKPWPVGVSPSTTAAHAAKSVLRLHRSTSVAVSAPCWGEHWCGRPSRGITEVGWHCFAGNLASGATARRIGFARAGAYPSYFAAFDEVENLAINGNVSLRGRLLRRGCSAVRPRNRAGMPPCCGGWPRRSARSRSGRLGLLCAGCTAARLDRRAAALDYLHAAIDRGFADRVRL